MFELQGKHAIVTGGARGIGKGIAMALAGQGASVCIADLMEQEAQAVAQKIESLGGRALAIATDVTDFESVKVMSIQSRMQFGPADILVNNAGWDRINPFLKTEPEFWEKVIAINFKGVLHTVHHIAPDMQEAGGGRIINIASDAARVGSMGESVYAGAKGAVISFSKTLARELARNQVCVNVICPGPTETQLLDDMRQDNDFAGKVLSNMDRIIPLKRMGTPGDIAAAVAFLASDEAGFITGQSFPCPAG